MNYQIIQEGFVSRRLPGTPTGSASGPRCALSGPNEVVCTFMVQSKLGSNDFQPMISRSTDGGSSWSEAVAIWPDLQGKWSIFGSVSRAPSGELLYFGGRTPIDSPGESFWSDATQGLKQNGLFWTSSGDSGRTWAPFSEIAMPIPGSAEVPGPMCATRGKRLVCCYSPYNTFDPKVTVAKNQVICLSSPDRGKSWSHAAMLQFPFADSSGAEAWVAELSDGRLLGTSWHIRGQDNPPNAYGISHDGGVTWSATASTGIFGQSTALTPLPDGRALFAYNQRKQGEIGVWLAVVKPSETDFGVQFNRPVWRAEIAARTADATDHKTWTDFAFGEPSVAILPHGDLLLVLWAAQPSGSGIPYVRLRLPASAR